MGAHTVNRLTARECCVYLVSVALLLLPSPLLVSLVFVLEKGQVQYMASMATTVLTLLCFLPAIILAKVESFDIKFKIQNHVYLKMPCPAPIQQLWHPGQRARRSPESKLLPAGKVAKHSHSSRRTTSVFVLVEAKIIPQQGPNQVTFLSSGCDNYYNGEVMPCLMRPWLPPFSYSTTEVRSAGQRTHVLMFLCFPQMLVTTLIRRAMNIEHIC